MTNTDTPKITVRLANQPDSDGDFIARVYLGGSWDRTFIARERKVALDRATKYVAWLRDHDASEEEIEL